MSSIWHSPLRQGGWEFSVHPDSGPSEFPQLKELWHVGPIYTSDFEWCIKHLDSGIKFRFHFSDAIKKWKEEKETCNPLASDFPSYGSPLLPAFGYDSAYVGVPLIEKPDEETRICCPEWEDIDFENLGEQIVWAIKNEQISGAPSPYIFHKDDGPTEPKNLSKKRMSVRKKSKEKGLPHPVLNCSLPLYFSFDKHGRMYCDLYLVVTHSGWFVNLWQNFHCKCNRAKREREMTMHCNFEQNIIYREIIERQSMHFVEGLCKVCKKMGENQDDEMSVCFHEAKQFKIQEAYKGGSSYRLVCDAGRYSSVAVGALKKTYHGALDVSDEKIGLLFANRGEKIKSIEAKTGTRIQIIPLFRHPHNPKMTAQKISISRLPGKAPRRAYINGWEDNVEYAKSCLHKLLVGYVDSGLQYSYIHLEPAGHVALKRKRMEKRKLTLTCNLQKKLYLMSLPFTENSNEGSVKYCRQCLDVGYCFGHTLFFVFCFFFFLFRLLQVCNVIKAIAIEDDV